MRLNIQVQHSADAERIGSVMSTFDCDTGPLALPKHIRIGGKTWDGKRIDNYDMQVDEYGVWLEDQIKEGNQTVMDALDTIFSKAETGIVLSTRCCPQPYITHAHKIQQQIQALVAQMEQADGKDQQS